MNLKQAINAYWGDDEKLGQWVLDHTIDVSLRFVDEDGNEETLYIGKCRVNSEDVGYCARLDFGDLLEDDVDEEEEEETEGGDGAANFV